MTLPTKINGHKHEPFAQACPREDVSAPSGQEEIWTARDRRTGAYLGPIRGTSHHEAIVRASDLYEVPLEHVDIPPRRVA